VTPEQLEFDGNAGDQRQDQAGGDEAHDGLPGGVPGDANGAQQRAQIANVAGGFLVDRLHVPFQRAAAAACRAVALDDASSLAHMALGTVHIFAEETDLGLAEALRVLELNPNYAHAAMAVGNRLDLVGRTEKGIAGLEHALTLNPRDPYRWRYMAYLSRAYISQEHYERAAEWSEKAVMLRPDLAEALFRHAVCLAHLDRVDEARSLLDRCTAIDPSYVAKKADWQPYPDAKRNAHIMAGLRRHKLIG